MRQGLPSCYRSCWALLILLAGGSAASCGSERQSTGTCRGETTRCSGHCVDTDVDPLHCGRCDSPCSDGVCVGGVCLREGGTGGVGQGSGGSGGMAAGGHGPGGSGGVATGGHGPGVGGTPAGGANLAGSMAGNPHGTGGTGGSPRPAGGQAGNAGATGGGPMGGSGGSLYPCPPELPSDGDHCNFRGRGGSVYCRYGECPPGTLTAPRYTAVCPITASEAASWTVSEYDCPPAIECGECAPGMDCGAQCTSGCGTNQCLVGEICLRRVYPDGRWNWDCAPNDCEAQPLDCSCAGAACGQQASGNWQCTAADEPIITC